VQPDVLVDPFSESELTAAKETQEQARRRSTGEVDLEGHFENKAGTKTPSAAPEPAPEASVEPEGEAANTAEAKEARFQKQLPVDRQLTRALELLKSWTIFSKLHGETASTTP